MHQLQKTGIVAASRTSLWQRVLRGLVVIGLVTGGSTLVNASAAQAALGGCNNYDTTSACINFGHDGNLARVDFYQNRQPGQAYRSYKVYIIVNGNTYYLGGNVLTSTGRYCCWYRNTDSLPSILYTVRSRIDIFSEGGFLHIQSYSPKIKYYN